MALPLDSHQPFRAPTRAIRTLHDLSQFKKSQTYYEFMAFVRLCNDTVIGIPRSSVEPNAGNARTGSVEHIVAMLELMRSWIDDIPPLDEPMRFGNKAFRRWYKKLEDEAEGMVISLLRGSNHEAAVIELMPYLLASFGHPSRIDYGTGHETTFVVWLCCLFKLGVLAKDDVKSVVLKIFHSYLQVMHKLQTVYMLEPAGSHGVWGLDDYHCLPFMWGSAQLIDHGAITPNDIHDKAVLTEGREEYLYLDAIDFIKSLKKGAAFGECCPMLNDISNLPSWRKVNIGMQRLYEGDVLGKLPVIQHFMFGSILPCTWEASAVPVNIPGPVDTRAPWARNTGPLPAARTTHEASVIANERKKGLEYIQGANGYLNQLYPDLGGMVRSATILQRVMGDTHGVLELSWNSVAFVSGRVSATRTRPQKRRSLHAVMVVGPLNAVRKGNLVVIIPLTSVPEPVPI